MNILVNLLINAIAIGITAYVLQGVHVDGPVAAVVTAVVLGIANAVLKPILLILTLPVTLMTFGLFVLVLNALMVMLASAVVPGFRVDSFWWALAFSVVLTLVNGVLHRIQGSL